MAVTFKLEETEAQLIERERMKSLASDADVVAALNRFDHWVKKENLTHYDAVSQMLLFLRESIEAGTPLGNALFKRVDTNFQKMKDNAKDTDPRLRFAVHYVVDAFQTNRYLVNYDPKFYYMMNFISFAKFNFERSQRGSVLATFNTVLGGAYGSKSSYIYSLANPRMDSDGHPSPIDERQKGEARTLIETDVLSGYYNISFHNNNMGGRATWQEGEEIALGIYDFIQKPESRGLLCSLLPPDGPLHVDWNKNPWVYYPEHQGWISCPDPKDLLNYFDRMAAFKGPFD